MVPRAPTRGGGPAAENPQRQTPRPLPVVRTTDDLPESKAVLSGSSSRLVEVPQSPHSRAKADVGEIHGRSPSPPSVATSHHALLGYAGESCLRNSLREICTAGSVREENSAVPWWTGRSSPSRLPVGQRIQLADFSFVSSVNLSSCDSFSVVGCPSRDPSA